MIGREDYARWREDPVTRAVLAALEADARAQEDVWHQHSWVNGSASKELLLECRVRADAYRAMSQASYEAICEALGEKPRDE